MAQIARGHHTVPRFYLDRFADDGQQVGFANDGQQVGFANDGQQVAVVRLPGKVRYPRATR